ncbi:MAG: hypothetical protein JWM59_286 [Verrucomicrobiales bacterium]|nr:hypothetical protein [Verrucomicrobiales bacterium]
MRQSSKYILRHRRSLLEENQLIPLIGWLVLAPLISGAVCWFVSHPSDLVPAATVATAFGLLLYIGGAVQTRKFDRMTRERSGESICQFARHFRGPEFDPVVVRAAYEMTQEQIGRADLPIRPSDSLNKDYGIVNEDLDDLAADIAEVAHRSLEVDDQNLVCGPVRTVAELVWLLQRQPRLPA